MRWMQVYYCSLQTPRQCLYFPTLHSRGGLVCSRLLGTVLGSGTPSYTFSGEADESTVLCILLKTLRRQQQHVCIFHHYTAEVVMLHHRVKGWWIIISYNLLMLICNIFVGFTQKSCIWDIKKNCNKCHNITSNDGGDQLDGNSFLFVILQGFYLCFCFVILFYLFFYLWNQ